MSSIRRSRAELRELLLDEAAALCVEGGVLASSALTYKEVFARVEARHGVRVTAASVHERIWNGLADFQNDVMLRIISEPVVGVDAKFLADALSTSAAPEVLVVRSEARRLFMMLNDRTDKAMDDPRWMFFVAAWASWFQQKSAAEQDEANNSLGEALFQRYEGIRNHTIPMCETLLEVLGFEGRPEYFGNATTLEVAEHLTVLANALSVGLAMQRSLMPSLTNFDLPSEPGGELAPWGYFALAMSGLVDGLLQKVEMTA